MSKVTNLTIHTNLFSAKLFAECFALVRLCEFHFLNGQFLFTTKIINLDLIVT